jgi:hypothetical protein
LGERVGGRGGRGGVEACLAGVGAEVLALEVVKKGSKKNDKLISK